MDEKEPERISVEYIPISEIIPYRNNPRVNDKAVDIVATSIKEYGFKVPIILDKDNIVIAGHTRLKAALKLGIPEVPIIWAESLTDEQAKAFRLMDNKSHEYSSWDFDLLKQEMIELKNLKFEVGLTGFDMDEIKFFNFNKEDQANNAYTEWRKNAVLDYLNDDKTGFKTILLHFPDQDAIDDFCKLINQNMTPKTKFLWYPKEPEDEVADLQYEEK